MLSIGSLVGFVTLFGISTRNAVMLIAHYQHLVAVEGAPWNLETAMRGAEERLGPILMTAIVTGIALLPLAVGSGDPGREIEGPLAVVILGRPGDVDVAQSFRLADAGACDSDASAAATSSAARPPGLHTDRRCGRSARVPMGAAGERAGRPSMRAALDDDDRA